MKMYCVIQWDEDANTCAAEIYDQPTLAAFLNKKNAPGVVSTRDGVACLLSGKDRTVVAIFLLESAITPIVTQREVTTTVIERQLP